MVKPLSLMDHSVFTTVVMIYLELIFQIVDSQYNIMDRESLSKDLVLGKQTALISKGNPVDCKKNIVILN